MNARFAILTQGNKTKIIDKDGMAYSEGELALISKEVFFDRVASETIVVETADGLPKRIPIGKHWMEHKKAEQYHALVFDPSKKPGPNGRTWNLWQGFAFEAIHGDWSLLKTHILENICSGDWQRYEWLMNWMALGVRHPEEVIGTAPVLKGLPGTGKGVLANAYGRLWGPHYIAVTHEAQVTGRFNAHFEARRFVFIDEGMFGGNRKDAGIIKTRLTEPYVVLERKGVDAIRIRNRAIFMVASNEESIVPADLGDRRWMIFEVGDAHREDHEYFEAVARQLEAGGYAGMLHELLNRDFRKGPDPRRTIKNEGLSEQIIRAQPADVRYLRQILDEGRLPQNDMSGRNVTTTKALWAEMQATQADAKYVSQIRLGKFLGQVIPEIERKGSGRYKAPGSERGGFERSTQLMFPPLSICRRRFEQHLGTPVAWTNELMEWQLDDGGII
jgi:hypothetical protein